MESFCDLLEELNRTEKEYKIKSKQYSELRSILLQNSHDHKTTGSKSAMKSTSSKDNILTNKKIGCRSSSEQGKIEPDSDSLSLKKMVKNRIQEYNSIKSNMERFKCKDREKIKFMETLQQDNRDILSSLHVDCVQKLLDSIEQ